jgi:prophage regulatory protein
MDTKKAFDRLISIKEVIHICGISRSHIYALAKQGKFPGPYDLSENKPNRCSRWSFLEVDDWVNQIKGLKQAL